MRSHTIVVARGALLALIATATLAAVAPIGALARPPHDTPVAAARSDMSPNQMSVADQAAPVPIARVTRVAGGFDWLDASIGAGLTAAVLLGAAGIWSLRRRPTLPVR